MMSMCWCSESMSSSCMINGVCSVSVWLSETSNASESSFIFNPVSSWTSRMTQSSGSSPSSMCPPGGSQVLSFLCLRSKTFASACRSTMYAVATKCFAFFNCETVFLNVLFGSLFQVFQVAVPFLGRFKDCSAFFRDFLELFLQLCSRLARDFVQRLRHFAYVLEENLLSRFGIFSLLQAVQVNRDLPSALHQRKAYFGDYFFFCRDCQLSSARIRHINADEVDEYGNRHFLPVLEFVTVPFDAFHRFRGGAASRVEQQGHAVGEAHCLAFGCSVRAVLPRLSAEGYRRFHEKRNASAEHARLAFAYCEHFRLEQILQAFLDLLFADGDECVHVGVEKLDFAECVDNHFRLLPLHFRRVFLEINSGA